jgi:hypothetical protein
MVERDRLRCGVGCKTLIVTIAISLAVSLPAILSGYVMDDLVFTSPMYQPEMPFGYYRYIDEMRRLDILPWWAADGLEVNFFRVLSSASLYLDFHLGRDLPLVAHLQSALWFAILLFGAARLLGALVKNPRQRRWAFVIFALGSYHTFAVGFIAARHALMGGTFAVWAAALYLEWHQNQDRKRFVAAMVLFFLGLLSGETALAFAGFAFAHDLAYVEGSLRRKLAVFSPVGLAAAAYLLFYTTMGFGPEGSGMYVDPLTNPVDFLAAAPPKVLAMMGAFTLGMPAHLRMAEGLEGAPLAAGAIGLALSLPVILLTWRHLSDDEKHLAKWCSLMGLLTMAPGLSGITSGRAVSMSGLAFSIIMAIALCVVRFAPLSTARKWLARPLAVVIVLGLVVMAPLSRLAQSYFMLDWGSILTTKLAESAPLPCEEGASVYVLNGDFLTAYYAPFLVAKSLGQLRGRWHELVSTSSAITVRRDGPDILYIADEGDSLIGPMSFELFADSRTALPEGTVIERDGLFVSVDKRSRKGPTALSFRIPDLENPRKVCLLTLRNYAFEPFPLPRRGQTVTVPYQQPKP